GGKIVCYQLPKPDQTTAPGPAAKREETPAPPQPAGPIYDVLSSRGTTITSISPLETPRAYRAPVPTGPQPVVRWSRGSGGRLEQVPLLTKEAVALATSEGRFLAYAKETGELLYDVPTHSTVAAPPAQHGETAYLVSQDYSLYAVDTALGRLLWRFA